MTRTRTQYKLIWKREGLSQKTKTFWSLKRAEWRRDFMLADEPWRLLKEYADRDASNYFCCDGSPHRECGCGGITIQEQFDRKDMPKIEHIEIQERQVTTTQWAGKSVGAR